MIFVIKYENHSTKIHEIKDELNKEEHNVRNILNARSWITKEPLNTFFCRLRASIE